MRTALCALALGGMLLGSCSTMRSGPAVESKVGRSFQRMLSLPGHLLRGEGRRGRPLLQAAAPGRWVQPAELRGGFATATQRLGHAMRQLQGLPGVVTTATGAAGRRMTAGTHRLTHPQRLDLHEPDRLQRALGTWRRDLRRLPELLGLVRPILPGPGDPHLTTDPYQDGRPLTWVERLLLRF